MTIKMIKKTLDAVDSNGVPRRWVVYYDNKHKLVEIKSLYNPTQYTGSRPLYDDMQMIKILMKEKENKK